MKEKTKITVLGHIGEDKLVCDLEYHDVKCRRIMNVGSEVVDKVKKQYQEKGLILNDLTNHAYRYDPMFAEKHLNEVFHFL